MNPKTTYGDSEFRFGMISNIETSTTSKFKKKKSHRIAEIKN